MKIRTFIAVDIPEDIKEDIEKAKRALKNIGDVKWVERENIHITLEFLGNLEPGEVERLKEALSRGLEGERKFPLTTGGIGAFPSLSSPRIIWVGVEGEGIKRLHDRVEGIVKGLGLKVEEREFSPHITIGRARRNIKGFIGGVEIPKKSFIIDGVNLMRSDLTPKGPIYTVLLRVDLK